MRVIARSTLRDYWEHHLDAQEALETWYEDAKRAKWRTPADIKSVYHNASLLGNNRVVFNIKGNRYRLVVAIKYEQGIVFIRFVGTHREYDRIDVETV